MGRLANQRLVVTHRVVADQPIGHRKDLGGAAIVVLQVDDFGVRPIVLEVQDVRHIGAAPSVNRLIVIPHDTEISVSQRQVFGDPILAAVGVLVFVDEHMIVVGRFFVADRGVLVEQRFGLQQQIVEVHRPASSQGILVATIGGGGKVFAVGRRDVGRLLRLNRRVLPAADDRQHVARSQRRAGQPQFAQDAAGQRFLVAAIVDRELGRKAECFGMTAENPHALRVKRADRRASVCRPALRPASRLLHAHGLQADALLRA